MYDLKTYTLKDARRLLPWLDEVSKDAYEKIISLRRLRLDEQSMQEQVGRIIHYWAETVLKLGAIPKQPFKVDFDSGKDYYCWQFPEKDISHRHAYHAGDAGRKKIKD